MTAFGGDEVVCPFEEISDLIMKSRRVISVSAVAWHPRDESLTLVDESYGSDEIN